MTSASTQSTPADWYRIINTVWSSSLLQMSHTLCCVSSKRLSSATQTLKVSLGVFFSISGASWSRTRWAGAASSHPLTSAFTRFWLNLRVRVWFAPRGSGPVLLKSASKKKRNPSLTLQQFVLTFVWRVQLLLLRLHFSYWLLTVRWFQRRGRTGTFSATPTMPLQSRHI